ncbi:MAG TPA: PAS domain-containing sensor histidine kinase [Candidatus Nanoarchaeia archaeon]|nr:PAS domain-containing sensor histidine kinase [Candidatus Nanoarchaeia archaeon]
MKKEEGAILSDSDKTRLEVQYQRIMDAVDGHFFYVHDLKGVFTYLSSSIKQVLGYSVAEFSTNYKKYLTNSSIKKKVIASTNKSMKGIEQPPFLIDIKHKNGTVRTLQVKEIPVRNEKGKIVSVEGIAEDVTQKKIIEERLLDNESKYQTLVEASGVAIFMTDSEANCTYANPFLLKIQGTTFSNVSGHKWMRYIHPDDIKNLTKTWNTAAKHNKPFELEYRLLAANGKYVWVFGEANKIKNNKGKTVSFIGTVVDITHRKEIEEELRRVDILKDELISIAGHELKTPLTSILGLTQMTMEGGFGTINKEQKENFEIIIKDALRLRDLIESMLDVSRIEHGRMSYDCVRFNISDMLNDTMQAALQLASQREVTIDIKSKSKLFITADRGRIRQTISNLITNAVKYGKKKGHIWISFHREGHNAVISVKDDGIGISKENMTKLFKKMYQVDQSSARIAGGIGFGLYISKRIIEEGHNGKIWLDSKLGHGSTFYVSLPIHHKKKSVLIHS